MTMYCNNIIIVTALQRRNSHYYGRQLSDYIEIDILLNADWMHCSGHKLCIIGANKCSNAILYYNNGFFICRNVGCVLHGFQCDLALVRP